MKNRKFCRTDTGLTGRKTTANMGTERRSILLFPSLFSRPAFRKNSRLPCGTGCAALFATHFVREKCLSELRRGFFVFGRMRYF